MKDLYDNPKKLGFGLMRLPLIKDGGNEIVDQVELKKMVDMYLERGFTYFDTAWMYCGFKSEDAAGEGTFPLCVPQVLCRNSRINMEWTPKDFRLPDVANTTL